MKQLSGKNILVVEDNMISFKLMDAYLSRTGLHLVHAIDGKEAMKHFHSQKFDLVLMDIQVPYHSGLELTRMMRESDPNLPIIATTANTFNEDREACLNAGCTDFITKPIYFPKLIDRICQLIDT
jgi:CheY-like chemotaxis protein